MKVEIVVSEQNHIINRCVVDVLYFRTDGIIFDSDVADCRIWLAEGSICDFKFGETWVTMNAER